MLKYRLLMHYRGKLWLFNSSSFTNLCVYYAFIYMYYYLFSDGLYVLGRLTDPRKLNYIEPLFDVRHCFGCFIYTLSYTLPNTVGKRYIYFF